jgi:GTP-binding protein HflX
MTVPDSNGHYAISTTDQDRGVLVGIDRPRNGGWDLEEDLAELERLTDTAGARVVGTITQRLERPNPRTFIGPGKVEEVASLARDCDANLVIFDEELTPSQQANLEKLLREVRVIDRTALILEIFALHATSREGKLQVELARMEYLLPRLRGLWGHLERERLGGGRGARFGAGESQLETDRRLARRRVSELKRELKHVAQNRETQRHSRAQSGLFRLSLVGYTNAGKSTLLNALTDAGVLVEDKLFATLDATTRRLELPEGRVVTLTDTVGFINKLPHGLIEAFKSTLDEILDADLQLHVVDASHSKAGSHIAAVNEVLDEIGAAGRPSVVVYNKCDALDAASRARIQASAPNAVLISATTGIGLDALMDRIAAEAARGERALTVLVPYTRGDLVRLAHERGRIISEEHTAAGTLLTVRLPVAVAAQFASLEAEQEPVSEPETGH